MNISPARLLALSYIDQRDLPNWESSLIKRDLRPRSIDPRDTDLADRILNGVIKELLILQRLIAEYSGRKRTQIDEPVQKILAMSLYQIRTMDRVPMHAIVSDAVELTKLVGHRSAAAFVNAVLRKSTTDRGVGKPPGKLPARDLAERQHSIPKSLFDRLAALYGETDALALCESFNAEPPTLARLIGTTTVDDLRAKGIEAGAHEQPGIVVLPALRRSDFATLSDDGLCQVQDATSAAVVDHLDLRPGQRVLDRCAGRGTKTQQILERIGADGQVVAMDTSKARLRSLEQLTKRRAITNVTPVLAGSIRELSETPVAFDRILIDAPCSNAGVLARRPEARYHQEADDVAEMVALQRQILRDSADALAVGGRLVYATCSIWPKENEQLIQSFLNADGRFKLIESVATPLRVATSPATYRDGGYFAALERIA